MSSATGATYTEFRDAVGRTHPRCVPGGLLERAEPALPRRRFRCGLLLANSRDKKNKSQKPERQYWTATL